MPRAVVINQDRQGGEAEAARKRISGRPCFSTSACGIENGYRLLWTASSYCFSDVSQSVFTGTPVCRHSAFHTALIGRFLNSSMSARRVV